MVIKKTLIITAYVLEYQIIDLIGKVVSTGKLTPENASINISELTNGIYFFKTTEDSTRILKIIKN